jgi:outer membrane protein assembly factor BamB
VPLLAFVLHLLWNFHAGAYLTATPAISAGRVYEGASSGVLYALDERTGKQLWKATLGANPNETYGHPRGIVGGVAVADGVVYAASGSCIAGAFDAVTGRELWKTKICSIARYDDVYAAPAVADGLVFVGIDILGDMPTDRGREIALDAATGRIRWTFYPQRYRGTGAGISTRAAIDSALGLAFIGTGNPTPAASPPSGPDVGSDSIIALRLRTGALHWSFGPVHPHDAYDEDMFASPNLFDAGGRTLIGEVNKDGTYYALGARTGRLVWKTAIPSHGYTLAIGTPAQGAGMLFVPLYSPGKTAVTRGALVALGERSGRERWRFSGAGMYEAPVYAGGVVYVTETNGRLDALDARTGRLITRVDFGGRFFGHGPSAAGNTLFVAHGTTVTALYRQAVRQERNVERDHRRPENDRERFDPHPRTW